MSKYRKVSLAVLVGALGFAVGIDAAEPSEVKPTKEMRATMAAAHERMAACLRTDRPMAECRDEMRKSAPTMREHCPMTGHMQMDEGAEKPEAAEHAHEH